MFGLGKNRTKLGSWLDNNGWSQEDLTNDSGLNRDTISKACSNDKYKPSKTTRRSIMGSIWKEDDDKSEDDFWGV